MKKTLVCLLLLSLGALQGCSPFFKVISAHFAKEFCSCLYVVGQSKEYCEEYAEEYIPTSGYEIHGDSKEIVAFGLGHRSVAQFVSTKYGCRLTE